MSPCPLCSGMVLPRVPVPGLYPCEWEGKPAHPECVKRALGPGAHVAIPFDLGKPGSDRGYKIEIRNPDVNDALLKEVNDLREERDDLKVQLASTIDRLVELQGKYESDVGMGAGMQIASLERELTVAREERDDIKARLDDANVEIRMWKANHGNQVAIKRAIMSRPDLKDRAVLVQELFAQIDKLQAFKDFVHRRLDEMGVEKEPDGEHSKQGCRIGDRLDIVEACVKASRDL